MNASTIDDWTPVCWTFTPLKTNKISALLINNYYSYSSKVSGALCLGRRAPIIRCIDQGSKEGNTITIICCAHIKEPSYYYSSKVSRALSTATIIRYKESGINSRDQ